MPCSLCHLAGHNRATCAKKTLTEPEAEVAMPRAKKAAPPTEDRYSEDVLRRRFSAFRTFYSSGLELKDVLDIRMTNMPEDISENITKFIIRNKLGVDSQWARHVEKTGDLWSVAEGVQENKCFMSDGPMSFGPEKTWSVLYCLDLRKWMDDVIVLYRVTLTPADEQWQNIRMSGERSKKKEGGETWRDQCHTRGARPHIGWEALYPQIREHCTEVYRGSFEGIFSKGTSLPAMSSTTGIETALPANEYSLASDNAGSTNESGNP